MRSGLEVVILGDGFVISSTRRQIREELRGEDLELVQELASFCERHDISSRTVTLFVAEDLVYGLSLDLPLRTPDIKEAVGLQLGLLLPFSAEEALRAYSVLKRADGYRALAFAVRAKVVTGVVEGLVGGGYSVKGIYPESQRYLTARMRRRKWALVMAGRQEKVMVFDGLQLQNRMLLAGEKLTYEKLSELCGTGLVLHTDPSRGSSFVDAEPLLAETPLLREYNLMPDSYRRPDYLKMVLVVVVILNLLALGGAVWMRIDNLHTQIAQAERERVALLPLVAEVDKTKAEIKKVEEFVATLNGIGKNPDLIGVMQTLSSDLPSDSYLDQFKFESKGRLLTINGYANDLNALTDKLKNLGEVRLKSTNRRKDRNYFQVEISLHE